MKIIAIILLAALLSGCAGQNMPKWKASVTGTYHGATYGASYDGKTIRTDVSLGDSLFGWAK